VIITKLATDKKSQAKNKNHNKGNKKGANSALKG
jgi:hypothetical protein